MVNPDRNLYEPPYDDALLYDTETEPERPHSRSLIVMLGFVVVAAFAGVVWVAYNQGVIQGQRDRNPPVLAGDPGPYQVPAEKTPSSDTIAVAPEKSYDELWDGETGSGDVASTDPSPQADRSAPTMQDVVGDGPTGGPQGAAAIDPRMDPTVDVAEASAAKAPVAPPVAPPVVRDATPPAVIPVRTTQEARVTPDASAGSVATKPVAVAPAPELAPEPPAAVTDTPPATSAVGPGGIGIQLGAFPSSESAAAHWSKIKGKHQALLGPYTPRFLPVQIEGKGQLFRLRVVGFPDKAAAKSACDEITGAGGACMPVGK